MLNILRRMEDGLVVVLRTVLLVFTLALLVGMALWCWEFFKPGKAEPAQAVGSEQLALNWKDAQLDLGFVVDETQRDLGNMVNDIPMEKRLADPSLRPSFQKADGLLRGFVYMNPAQRKRIEKDNSGQGLAPLNPLLKGDALPTPEEVKRQIKKREAQENGECCSADAADAAASTLDAAVGAAQVQRIADRAMPALEMEMEDEEFLNDPVDVASSIHEKAAMAQMEHGEGAYAAYVQGLPAALEKVFGNEKLAPALRNQGAQSLVGMVLINYTLSFDRAAAQLKGEEPLSSTWVDKFQSMETAFWSMLMSFLVLVVMVLVFFRIERHLKALSQSAQPK